VKIVGLFMVKNEDVYIEQAIRNVVDFCDIIYVDDNESTDRTPQILKRLEKEFHHLHVRSIADTIESNEKLVPYFGTHTWVFAVDGDEIYDRDRLPEMRRRLEAGEFDDWWLVLGNCLHVAKINDDRSRAEGYLAPPSSSMTKLYNFSLIDDFPIKDERLHGTPVFKDGGDAPSKWFYFCRNQTWEDSCFRCVHTAFVDRTSKPKDQKRILGVRLNPPQIYTLKKIWKDNRFFYALPRAIKLVIEIILGMDSRQKRYKSGPRVTKDVSGFFVPETTQSSPPQGSTVP
jgi:glycosyltransferase involved in cell wall biosynthesis